MFGFSWKQLAVVLAVAVVAGIFITPRVSAAINKAKAS